MPMKIEKKRFLKVLAYISFWLEVTLTAGLLAAQVLGYLHVFSGNSQEFFLVVFVILPLVNLMHGFINLVWLSDIKKWGKALVAMFFTNLLILAISVVGNLLGMYLLAFLLATAMT